MRWEGGEVGAELAQEASKFLPLNSRGSVGLASSEVGKEGFGKSKADSLKAMEEAATFYLG